MQLTIANNLTQIDGIQQTYVASAINVGGTSSPVRNIAGFTNQWAVQFGQTGEEQAEIMLVSGVPSGTQLNFGTSPSHTAGTLFFNHSQDTPLYQIHYDQFIINRSTAGTGGPFSSLATISITPDNPFTSYNDATGAAGYAYYVQYYNSVTGDLSGTSSIFVPGGPTFYSLQKIRQRTKDKLYSAGYIREDAIITDWINEAIEGMSNAAIKVNEDYMLGTNQYSFGTNGLGTVTDTAFKPNVVKVEVTWDGINYIPSTKLSVREYSENDIVNNNSFAPQHAWIGDTVFEILPHTKAGTAKLTYPQRFTPLVNDSDELPQSMKAYTTPVVEYCLGVAYGLDQKDAESQQHMQLYMQGKQDFVSEITPRDMTGAQMIDIIDGLSGMQEDLQGNMGDFVW